MVNKEVKTETLCKSQYYYTIKDHFTHMLLGLRYSLNLNPCFSNFWKHAFPTLEISAWVKSPHIFFLTELKKMLADFWLTQCVSLTLKGIHMRIWPIYTDLNTAGFTGTWISKKKIYQSLFFHPWCELVTKLSIFPPRI